MYRLRFRALRDILVSLRPLESITAITESEIFAVCYFGRLIDVALSHSGGAGNGERKLNFPYQFTLSPAGGPYAEPLQKGLRMASRKALVVQPDSEQRTFELSRKGSEWLERTTNIVEDGERAGENCIEATARSAIMRPITLVTNAIYSEPSLETVRREADTSGVPLKPDLEDMRGWIHKLIDEFQGEQKATISESQYVVPMAIDALSKKGRKHEFAT